MDGSETEESKLLREDPDYVPSSRQDRKLWGKYQYSRWSEGVIARVQLKLKDDEKEEIKVETAEKDVEGENVDDPQYGN